MYLWAEGVPVLVRLEEDDLTLLVMIGVGPDGTKELVATDDGYRESAESWAAIERFVEAFGTTGHRRKKTRGHGSRSAALGMAFKSFESAEKRWRRMNAPHLVELVLLGAKFEDGIQVRSTPQRDAA